MTFNDVYDEWLAQKKLMVKESTVSIYRQRWDVRLKAYFGDMVIEDMRSRHFQKYVNERLSEGKLGRKTIEDDVIVVRNILNFAQLQYDLPTYIIKVIYPTEDETEESGYKKSFTPEEAKKLLNAIIAEVNFISVGYMLALCCGLRIGEICGLQFGDIDIVNQRINVRRTVQRVYVFPEDRQVVEGKKTLHTKCHVGTPKSKSSRRSVPLPDFLFKWLKNASKLFPSDYYIVTARGVPGTTPSDPRTLRNNYDRFLEKHGFLKVVFHGLRHTFASLMITSGADVKTTSKLLGHSDATTTLNVYSHTSPSVEASAARKAIAKIMK